MPQAGDLEERLQRVQQVMDLSSQGLGSYLIAKRLGVNPRTVLSDIRFYARSLKFLNNDSVRVGHLLSKSNRALQAAWSKLSPLLGNADSDPKDIAALLSVVNAIIGTQARILGIDHIQHVDRRTQQILIINKEPMTPSETSIPTIETEPLDDGNSPPPTNAP